MKSCPYVNHSVWALEAEISFLEGPRCCLRPTSFWNSLFCVRNYNLVDECTFKWTVSISRAFPSRKFHARFIFSQDLFSLRLRNVNKDLLRTSFVCNLHNKEPQYYPLKNALKGENSGANFREDGFMVGIRCFSRYFTFTEDTWKN